MTDTPISALPAGTTLSGSEIVPAVQGGVTKSFTITQIRTGTPSATYVETPYAASGVISVADDVAVFTGSANKTMTIGSGSAGHEMVLKQMGAGSVSVLGVFEGVSQGLTFDPASAVTSGTNTLNGYAKIKWSSQQSSWLVVG